MLNATFPSCLFFYIPNNYFPPSKVAKKTILNRVTQNLNHWINVFSRAQKKNKYWKKSGLETVDFIGFEVQSSINSKTRFKKKDGVFQKFLNKNERLERIFEITFLHVFMN